MQLQLQLQQEEEEQQPQQQICGQLKCPRCSSSNTKFCYYNNYNKSQPRHFCKACKRHWTRGGTLRNVPVGGARKNKHFKTTTSSTTTTTTTAKKRKGNTSCSSSTTTSDNQEQQPWQSNREVPGFPNYVNYNDLNGEDHNMKISLVGGAQNLLLSHLPSTFPFIASSSTTELIGSSTIDHTCLISPFNAQFGQFAPSSSASTTSSDSHNYVSSTAIATTAVDPSSSTITDCVDSLSWDYLDTLISTDLKLPWEDYFQTQEPVT